MCMRPKSKARENKYASRMLDISNFAAKIGSFEYHIVFYYM